jgi:hypothetical protein
LAARDLRNALNSVKRYLPHIIVQPSVELAHMASWLAKYVVGKLGLLNAH